jgi:hypothetical protein
MADLALISGALTSLKTATEIAKLLRESNFSLEKAELKLKVADLISALADVKIELVDLQDTLIEKDKQIVALEAAFEIKDTLIRKGDTYYKLDEQGQKIGGPYCPRCWENDHKNRQLVHNPKNVRSWICATCHQEYHGLTTRHVKMRAL